MKKYEIVVSNIGTVYQGNSKKEAEKIYNEYIKLSKGNYGRACGENCYFMKNGEPLKTFYGYITMQDRIQKSHKET